MKKEIIALVMLAIVICSSLTEAQAVKLQSAYSTIAVGQSLIWVTKEAGIFKENGLDVQLLFIGSSTIVTQAIIGGIQLALEEIGERNPAAKSARSEQFIDASFVKELDESGYIDALYK